MGYFKKTQLAALSQGGVSLHAQVAHGRTNCGDVGLCLICRQERWQQQNAWPVEKKKCN